MLSVHQLNQLLDIIRDFIGSYRPMEWTIEAKPGTLTKEKLGILREAGVNRVSLGVQTMDDSLLTRLQCRHTRADIISTVKLLRDTGFDNFGLDLIAGLPATDTRQWRADIEAVMALKPRHISVYTLDLEPGSAMRKDVDAKKLVLPDEDAQLAAIHLADELLSAAGWLRYEISNYAQPGFECRHNLDFWRGGDYLGFGPAAASRSGLARRTNLPDLSAYITALSCGPEPPFEMETLSPDVDYKERLAFALRLSEGVDVARTTDPAIIATLEELALKGLVQLTEGSWQLTRIGWDFADHVTRELL